MTVLDKEIAKIHDQNARDVLTICTERRKYPRDCVTDGALEKLARYIVELEARDGA